MDLVTVAQVLHWFDLDAFYQQVRRVLRPRGALAVYVNVPFPFEELSSPAFELERTFSFAELCGYLRSWSATGRFVAERGFDPVAALEDELASLWGDAARRRRIRWPLTLRVGR